MTGPWVLAFSAIVILQLLLVIFVMGLAHRVMRILARVEAGLPIAEDLDNLHPTRLAVGDPVPDLPVLVDAGSDSNVSRGYLILFIEHDCQPCQVLAADMRQSRPEKAGYGLVAVVDDMAHFQPLPAAWAVVPDADRSVAAAWQVAGTPLAYIIDDKGRISAIGVPNTSGDLKRLLRQGANESRRRRPNTHSTSILESRQL